MSGVSMDRGWKMVEPRDVLTVSDMSTACKKDLLAVLRQGNLAAYEELWCRHHRSAMTLAHRLAPGHAEDLVADSFTAVLHTTTVSGKGPVDGFRSYLFATMRNSAARWSKDRNTVFPVADPDEFLKEDADNTSAPLETAEDSAALIRAFRDLPGRWQQILWLAEVEETPRPQIAVDLGIKPNAVSALLRRARKGLQAAWLEELLPNKLRHNKHHFARSLPKYVSGQLSEKKRDEVAHHLATCSQCTEAHEELTDVWWKMGNQTLKTLGFGALGATLLAGLKTTGFGTGVASAATMGSAGAGTASGTGAAGAVSSAEAVGLAGAAGTVGSGAVGSGAAGFTIGGTTLFGATATLKGLAVAATVLLMVDVAVLGAVSLFGNEGDSASASGNATSATLSLGEDEVASPATNPVEDAERPTPPTGADDAGSGPWQGPSTEVPDPSNPPGRFSGDECVPYLDISSGGTAYQPAERPNPSSPETVTPPSGPDTEETEVLETPQFVPTQTLEFIAPVMAGTANPGAAVNIEVAALAGARTSSEVYVTHADETGHWSFDLSTLALEETQYRLQVWQSDHGIASEAATSTFTLSGVGVTLLSHLSVDALDAELDGFPVDFNGMANGTVCLVTNTDQRFDIPLDGNGTARRFIRLVGAWDYELRFLNCDGQRYGPAYTSLIEVVPEGMPGFGPFSTLEERRVLVDME